jgi:rare lipoprotein A
MATVPSAALFGFAGLHSMTPMPAAAAVISMPATPVAPSTALPDPLPDRAPEAPLKAVEASYYGKGFAGKPTASGERFNPENLTAAHRTLPFGTIVKVTHAATGKSVTVEINDRGPFHGNREIDLSTAAARDIGMIASGTAMVTLDVIGRA